MICSILLFDILWYEGISPEELAEFLELTPEILYHKIFGVSEFTNDEIRDITGFLGLSETDVNRIFFEGGGESA